MWERELSECGRERVSGRESKCGRERECVGE